MTKLILSDEEKNIVVNSIVSLFVSGSNFQAPVYLYEITKNIQNKKIYDELFNTKYIQDIITCLNEWFLPKNSWEYTTLTGVKLEDLKNIIQKIKGIVI